MIDRESAGNARRARTRKGSRWLPLVGEDERRGPGRRRRGEDSDGHQDVGRKSRPTHKASDDESVGDDRPRTPAAKTAAKSSATARKTAKATGPAAKTAAARSPKKKATTAPAKSAKPQAKARRPPGRAGAAAARTAPTKKTAPAKAAPNKAHRPVHASAGTATKRRDQGVGEDHSDDRRGHRGATRLRVDDPRAGPGTSRSLSHSSRRCSPSTTSRCVELDELQSSSTDGAGDDQADAGSKTFEREQELSIAANRLDLLTQIKRAVERIDAGTYGYCESCGKPIPKARLKAFPMATLDVACKQREERR